jgi:uncharacterized membrane protein
VARFLAAASIAWPLILAGGWWSGAHGGPVWFTSAVYLSAGRVCHQRPERSFSTLGVRWPVCGRCAGLYLAAPLGAIAALAWRRRRQPRPVWLIAAAVPTAAIIAIEWAGLAPVSSVARAWTSLPLGCAIGFYLIAVATPARNRPPGSVSLTFG